jgi:two-component system CheB/CheR fusion protein
MPDSLFKPPQMPVFGRWRVNIPDARIKTDRERAFSLGEVHYKLLEKFAPPSILVNHDFEVQYMSDTAGRFLKFKGGELHNNLLKLVNPDLLPDLRAALFSAQRDRETAEFKDVHCVIDGRDATVNIVVRAVDVDNAGDDFLLVIFDEGNDYIVPPEKIKKLPPKAIGKEAAAETAVRQIEEELARTKSNLRSTIEQHEISIEELKASNEELQAINEELRSATEELETSKEELQSVNEELTTVNAELKDKMDETSRANSDLQNLMASTDIATIFLDRSLRIKRFTPPIEKLFNITAADIGRPLSHFTNKLNYENLSEDAALVLRSLLPLEREISDKNEHFFIARLVPYRTVDDKIDGIVLNFLDITERRRIEEALSASEDHFRAFVTASSDVVYRMNGL